MEGAPRHLAGLRERAIAARTGTEPAAGTRIAQAGEARSARIESLRALAALSVLVSHAFVYSYGTPPTILGPLWHRIALEAGFAGVELFFVLSGYLLFWPFANTIGADTRVSLRRYALNRAVRILPLYYALVALLLIVQQHGGTWTEWWHYTTFTQNFSSRAFGLIDPPMWSLAVEVQFYLALPVLALGLRALSGGSRARAGAMLLVLAAGSLVLREVTVWHTHQQTLAWQFSLPSLFFFFAAGMGLALLRAAWLSKPPDWLRGPIASSTAWWAASLPLWAVVCWRISFEWAAALAAFVTVAACVLPLRPGAFVRFAEFRPLATVGLASYSLYLWHVPVLTAICAGGDLSVANPPLYGASPGDFVELLAIGTAISVPLALVSYRVIELPALSLRRRWSPSAVREAGRDGGSDR